MAVTILDALRNANYNLNTARTGVWSPEMGREQLKNAVGLLNKGYSLYDEVEPLLEKYGSIENVPEKEKG